MEKSEAVDGAHVRLAAIPPEKGDFVRWRLGGIEVSQHERYDGFADTQAVESMFPMSIERAARQRHTVHGHRKITAILDAAVVCFDKDMDQMIHEHPPRETEPDGVVVWLLFKAHSAARRACTIAGMEYFRSEVLMERWMRTHKAMDLPTCVPRSRACTGTGDSFMVEWKEHEVDIKVSTIMGTEAKIVGQVSSWKPAGITWVRVGLRAAALTPNTAANKSDKLSWDQAKARSLAGGTAIYLVLNRLDHSLPMTSKS